MKDIWGLALFSCRLRILGALALRRKSSVGSLLKPSLSDAAQPLALGIDAKLNNHRTPRRRGFDCDTEQDGLAREIKRWSTQRKCGSWKNRGSDAGKQA